MQEIHNQVKPQNGGNRVSQDLKFQNFPGKNAPLAAPFHWTPSHKNLVTCQPEMALSLEMYGHVLQMCYVSLQYFNSVSSEQEQFPH